MKELGCETESLRLSPSKIQLNKEFAAEEVFDESKRIHVIGRKTGSQQGKSLMIIAHPDGDPINSKDWTVPLHEGKIINNRIYGWAVADDLSGIGIFLEALDALNEGNFQLRGDLYLVSASAKNNAYGIAAILGRGYKTDAAIYLHPAESGLGLREIKTMTSGLLKFRIRVRGMKPPKNEFVQTTFSNLGVNPIYKVMYIINALKRLNKHRIRTIRYEPLNRELGRGTNLLVSYINAGRRDNLTDIPQDCHIGVGLTFPPYEDIDDLVMEIEDYLRQISRADPWLRNNPPELFWVQGTQGSEVPLNHPLVDLVVESIEKITGSKPKSNPLYSKSDLRTPMLIAGIPMIGFGPLAGDFSTTGGVNEWVDLEEYILSIKICAKIIMDWCEGNK
jgi:acetylornithine deacetylase